MCTITSLPSVWSSCPNSTQNKLLCVVCCVQNASTNTHNVHWPCNVSSLPAVCECIRLLDLKEALSFNRSTGYSIALVLWCPNLFTATSRSARRRSFLKLFFDIFATEVWLIDSPQIFGSTLGEPKAILTEKLYSITPRFQPYFLAKEILACRNCKKKLPFLTSCENVLHPLKVAKREGEEMWPCLTKKSNNQILSWDQMQLVIYWWVVQSQ